MIYLTYIEPIYSSTDPYYLYNSSGHVMLDIFATVIFGFLFDAKMIFHESWSLSKIISINAWKEYCDKPLESYDYEITIDYIKEWKGLSIEQLNELKDKIFTLSKIYKNILVKFTNVCKIHPHTLHFWYKENYLSYDMYSEKVIPKLKKLYYFDNNNEKLDIFSIHIRRGDLYKDMINVGYTYEYYKNIINIINKYLNIQIKIYCENFNYADILPLNQLKNTNVDIGGLDVFSKHFNEMCRSKYLFLSPSSFSIFTGYLSLGTVIGDEKLDKFRPNIFNNLKITPNFNIHDNINEFEEFIKKQSV